MLGGQVVNQSKRIFHVAARISAVPHDVAEKRARTEDLIRFWLGHANRSVTDVYSKLKEDVAFRKKVAEQVGIGFELPAEKPESHPIVPTGRFCHTLRK